jgi:hypothetical protein
MRMTRAGSQSISEIGRGRQILRDRYCAAEASRVESKTKALIGRCK